MSVGFFLAAILGATPDNKHVHENTKKCRQDVKLRCLYSCEPCHEKPWHPIELFDPDEGDLPLCTQCHDTTKESKFKFQDDCIKLHHEKNVDYPLEENSRTKLLKDPIDIKIFCDAKKNNCKVFCISCHKPMEEPGKRMRVEKYYLSCIRCHKKP